MILSAQSIRRRCVGKRPMISPFRERTHAYGVSYGLSAAGYDVRLEFDEAGLINSRWLYPGQCLLASAIEEFDLPLDIMMNIHDKSTLARVFVTLQTTVAEPGWRGYLTLEIINHSNEPVKLIRGMGIAQMVFHLLDEPTEQPYAGKYQNQERGPVEAVQMNLFDSDPNDD